MNRLWRCFGNVVALLVLAAGAAQSATFVILDSPPGEPLGSGIDRTLTSADGGFSGYESAYGPGVRITFQDANGYWNFEFVAPTGQTFNIGKYEGAAGTFFRSPAKPGIGVANSGRSCGTVAGRFTVREVEFGANNEVVKFAAEFAQFCDGSTQPLRGVVRYNSDVSAAPPDPIAVAGPARRVTEGDNVIVDGSLSYDLDGAIASYAWSQLSGPPIALSGASAAVASFVAPDVPAGGSTIVLELRVTDNDGRIDSETVAVHIRDALDPRSILRFNSQPGDYIGGGVKRTLSEDDASFAGRPFYNWGDISRGLEVFVQGPQWWNLEFGGVAGTGKLQPGTYLDAERAAFASAGHPGLDVFGDGRGCDDIRGRFTVIEVEYGVQDEVRKFAADFEQHCEGFTAALFGWVRLNSAVPISPRAPSVYVVSPKRVHEGAAFTLDASTSVDAQDSPLAFAWSQQSGPAVDLGTANASVLQLVAPLVAPGGVDLSFRVDVSNALGLSDSVTVIVHVVDSDDPQSRLHVYTIGGIPPSRTIDRDEWNARFTLSPFRYFPDSGIHVDVFGSGLWLLDFTGPAPASPLQLGDYDNATDPTYPPGTRPGLQLWLDGGACAGAGRFKVLEVEYAAPGNVSKLAVDFDQRCTNVSFVSFGSVRFNSAVPIAPRRPYAYVAPQPRAPELTLVALDATGSADPQASALTFAWTQTSGPTVFLTNGTTASPSFITPGVPPGGADLSFSVTVTNGFGVTDTASTTVHVVDATDPKSFLYIKSQAGDPVGNGQTETFNEWGGKFTAFAGFNNNVSVSFVSEDGLERWGVLLGPPLGSAGRLQLGEYRNAVGTNQATVGTPQIDVSGSYSYCVLSIAGRFTVIEIAYDSQGNLVKLAADFEQHCDGRKAALFGSIRYNSAVPLGARPPSAYATAPSRMLEALAVALDASDSVDPQDSPLRFRWLQVGGVPVTLSGSGSAHASFLAPKVGPGGQDLRFRVDVTNGLGLSDSASVTVHVVDASDPKFVLRIDSRPGNYVGGGVLRTIVESNGQFSPSNSHGNAPGDGVNLRVWIDNYDTSWDLYFAAPLGSPLILGAYPDAKSPQYPISPNPLMEIAGGSRGCYAINSSFRILEIGPLGNHLSKFAADFEQTCAGDQAPLYGSIRYNSAVPVTIVPFTSFTAASGAGWAGVTTSLLGGGPSCRFDNPHWLPQPPGTGDVPPSKPASDTVFPQGLLAFALDGCTRGAAVTITIRFPFTLPPGLVYWKYGPTVDNRAPHWYVVPAIITSNSVMFNIVDGGFGDDDLTVNGRIVDAGGLGTGATPPPPPVPPSAAGAATQIPTLSEAAVVALTLLLLSAGLLAVRRRTRDLRR